MELICIFVKHLTRFFCVTLQKYPHLFIVDHEVDYVQKEALQ